MFKGCCRFTVLIRASNFSEIYHKRNVTSEALHHPFFQTRSQIIDGKAISTKILSNLRNDIEKWVSLGFRRPHLSAIVIGEHPPSELYLRNKSKAAASCGITTDVVRCPSTITQRELLNIISDMNSDETVDAVLVQLPCPAHINKKLVFDTISSKKDVDGFNARNIANLSLREEGIVPCAALAVNTILQELDIPEAGLEAVIVGSSRYVGLPIFLSLQNKRHLEIANSLKKIAVTVCNKNTPQETLFNCVRRSDIIISAVGSPNVIKGDLIKPGAIVIDVGITLMTENKSGVKKFSGDVEFEKARERASYITPVPGGVGPVTVAMLMANTVHCAVLCKSRKLELVQANSMTED